MPLYLHCTLLCIVFVFVQIGSIKLFLFNVEFPSDFDLQYNTMQTHTCTLGAVFRVWQKFATNNIGPFSFVLQIGAQPVTVVSYTTASNPDASHARHGAPFVNLIWCSLKEFHSARNISRTSFVRFVVPELCSHFTFLISPHESFLQFSSW